MSEISLREYLSDLDRLLNQHAADDVILHSRHILQYYPKIVDAYRYLGRALILNGRWDEAEAAMRRVIAVVPDDYYAHTGLSEIYDRNRRGDEAIWHLERALEQNPNQRELIDSLRSLYKRYRNIDQAKVPMTAGAVARQAMANQSYEQAIETLRSALTRHKDRIDLRLLLAESLWAGGDPVEAAEAAMDVLEALPDCLSANKIMTQLWLQEGRSSDAQRYLNRVEAVAPYLAVELATNQPVDDNAFRIEKLDVKRSAQAELSLNRPDWLQDISPEAAAAQATADEWSSWSPEASGLLAAAGMAAKPEPAEESDWSADAQTLEQPVPSLFDMDSGSDQLVENTADTEMPDWMNAATMQVPLSTVQAAEDDALAWLQGTGSTSSDDEMPPDELLFGMDDGDPAPSIESEPMDWLKGFEEDGATSVTPIADMPDWMMDDPPATRSTPDPGFDSTPQPEPAQEFDWAANEQFLDEALGIENLAGNEPEPQPVSEPTVEDLDWLAGAAAFEAASAEPAADDALTGLTGILGDTGFETPAPEAEVSDSPVAEDDEWLDQVSNETAGVPGPKRGLTAMLKDANFDWMNEETSAEIPTAVDQTMDDWAKQFDPSPAQEEETPAWLNAIESTDDTAVMRAAFKATSEEVVTPEQDEPLTDVVEVVSASAEEVPAVMEDNFDWANVEEVSAEVEKSDNAYPALDTLLGLGAATAVAATAAGAFDQDEAEAMEPEPISESDLDWLGEVGVTVEQPPTTSEAINASEAELAALFGTPENEAAEPTSISENDLDWLNEAGVTVEEEEIVEVVAASDAELAALFDTSVSENEVEAVAQADDELEWLSEAGITVEDQLAEPITASEDELAALFEAAESEAEVEILAEAIAEDELDLLGEVEAAVEEEIAVEAMSTDDEDLEALFAAAEMEAEAASESELEWLTETGVAVEDQSALEAIAAGEADLAALFENDVTEVEAEAIAEAAAEGDLDWLSEVDVIVEDQQPLKAIAANEDDLAALFEASETEGVPQPEAQQDNEFDAIFATTAIAGLGAAAIAATNDDDEIAAEGETEIAYQPEFEPTPETEVGEVELDWLSSEDVAEPTEDEIIEAESDAVVQGLMTEFGLPVDENQSSEEEAQPAPEPESEDAVNWWETPESEEASEQEPEGEPENQIMDGELIAAEEQVAEVTIPSGEGDEIVDWFVDAELDEAALDSAPEVEVDPNDWYADSVQDEQIAEIGVAEETQYSVETLHFAASGEGEGDFPDWLTSVEDNELVEPVEAVVEDEVIDESVGVIEFIEVASIVSEVEEIDEESAVSSEADEDIFAEEIIAEAEAIEVMSESGDDDFLEEDIFGAQAAELEIAGMGEEALIDDDGEDEILLNEEPDELSPLAAAAALGTVGLAGVAIAGDDEAESLSAEIPEATQEEIEEEVAAELEGETVAEDIVEQAAAENAPDWLNAMVPGLDVDYEAEEDQPIETEYLEAEPEAVLAPDESDDSEFGWVEEMIAQEERESEAVVETADGHEPQFKFSREPLWFRIAHEDDFNADEPDATEDAGSDSDLPEWLR